MTSEKMFAGTMKNGESSSALFNEREKEFHRIDDQFFKLIENDEGVPFRLIFGNEPGEGYYYYIGEGFRKLLGTDSRVLSERVFNGMIRETIPLSENLPSDPVAFRSKLLDGEISSYKIEMRIDCHSGEAKWIREASITVREEKTGRVSGVIGILHDVSERRNVQAYLAELSEKANECDRLKNAFLQNISHEVRTPLNAIVGFSTLLCEPEEPYGVKKEFVSLINNSTDHFLEIMDNIMEISRIESGTATVVRTQVQPESVLKRIHRNFIRRAEEKKLILDCRIPSSREVTLITDSYKFAQVLNSLVSNAVKFTMSGKIEFGYDLKDGHIEFYVSDTGIGIKEEHRSQIFNKFFQAESGVTRRFPGTGLGLSISKAYSDMLGGTIDFSSKPGEGSTFRFRLPAGMDDQGN